MHYSDPQYDGSTPLSRLEEAYVLELMQGFRIGEAFFRANEGKWASGRNAPLVGPWMALDETIRRRYSLAAAKWARRRQQTASLRTNFLMAEIERETLKLKSAARQTIASIMAQAEADGDRKNALIAAKALLGEGESIKAAERLAANLIVTRGVTYVHAEPEDEATPTDQA